ncbi:MAG: LON peptidase substrate-binding domain-containing protein, partial [Candidatus Krumholzibacteria bacterium]|nr:LON peptidase substrate-binding domain-containing protein [Candidatus Krumholzibacteria bacterium]
MDGRMQNSETIIPLVPLRDVVIFPTTTTAILVGRQPSINAVERAIESDKILLVAAQRDPSENEPDSEDLYTVGTLVRIGIFLRLPDGTLKIMLEGISRVRIEEFVDMDTYTGARVRPVETTGKMSREIEALTRKVEAQFEEYVRMHPRIPNEVMLSLQALDDRSHLADTVAAHLQIRNDAKQRLLEAFELEARLLELSRILHEEVEMLRLEKDIEDKVTSQVTKNQKELFLQEKMKAIRSELGHGDDADMFEDLERRIQIGRA